jgi:hypothetical protein
MPATRRVLPRCSKRRLLSAAILMVNMAGSVPSPKNSILAEASSMVSAVTAQLRAL